MNNTPQTDHFRKMLTDRYAKELLKLKTVNQFGRHSVHFLGYPNTLMMKRCRRELERRRLPVPPVNPPGDIQGEPEGPHKSQEP